MFNCKPELLDEAAAAGYIGMSVAFLRAGRCHGQVGNRTPSPAYMKLGRSVRYARADLDAWLTARRRTSTSDPGPTEQPAA